MIKIKVADATCEQIDHLVAKALGWVDYPSDSIEHGSKWHCDTDKAPFGKVMWKKHFNPSTNWLQGGSIIDMEDIEFVLAKEGDHHESAKWMAIIRNSHFGFAETHLIAALRCYVASKLGNDVEVPKELENK